MPGRFALHASVQQLSEYLDEAVPEIFVSRYNIAPTTPVIAKTENGLTFFSWGLVPSWAKDVEIGNRLYNARAETVAEKPSFRNAFKRRRCLVPASGFYEWKAEAGASQPYYCHLQQSLFCFAGIWEHWQDAMGNELQTCSILTMAARGALVELGQRMPVVLREQNRDIWLDHSSEEIDEAQHCIADANDEFLFYPVAQMVNAARNDAPELIRPM